MNLSKTIRWVTVGGALLLALSAARAEEMAPKPRRWLFGAQLTQIDQIHPPLKSPYANPAISFGPGTNFGWSVSASLFGAVSPWKGCFLMLEPEYSNGRGMPNASGVSGYPNGEIVRAGSLGKFPYIARGFFHQDFILGDARNDEVPEFEDRLMPGGVHALGAGNSASRIELTLGKFAATDFFDSSEIATDPRHHFLNWALMQEGAWDAAADTRGYTYGLVLGLDQPVFSVRAGVMLMPKTANGSHFDWNVAHSRSEAVEGEYRYAIKGRKGSVKAMMYINHAHMGNYDDAIANTSAGSVPDITTVRRTGAIKFGGGILIDQEVTDSLRTFFRAGANDGQTETFAFTEIDRSVSLGFDLVGKPWNRPNDHLALGAAFNGISAAHARYLAAGGQGFQLGDGRLHNAWETIIEAYYLVPVVRYVEITGDVQGIFNPGMNSDRGPAVVFGLRLHGHY